MNKQAHLCTLIYDPFYDMERSIISSLGLDNIENPYDIKLRSNVSNQVVTKQPISETISDSQTYRTHRRSVRFAEPISSIRFIPSRFQDVNKVLETKVIETSIFNGIQASREPVKPVLHRAKPNIKIQIPEEISFNISEIKGVKAKHNPYPNVDRNFVSSDEEDDEIEEDSDDSDDDWYKKKPVKENFVKEDDKENYHNTSNSTSNSTLDEFMGCGWMKSVQTQWYQEHINKPLKINQEIYNILEFRSSVIEKDDPVEAQKVREKLQSQQIKDMRKLLETIDKGRKLFSLDQSKKGGDKRVPL